MPARIPVRPDCQAVNRLLGHGFCRRVQGFRRWRGALNVSPPAAVPIVLQALQGLWDAALRLGPFARARRMRRRGPAYAHATPTIPCP